MAEIDLANAVGPTFWVLMAVLTVALMGIGYWLGGIIARKTDTGFGAFMIVVLVTIMVASSVIPLAIFGALGDIMGIVNPLGAIDETLIADQGFVAYERIMVAALVSTGSTVAFFIASVIGLARGRI